MVLKVSCRCESEMQVGHLESGLAACVISCRRVGVACAAGCQPASRATPIALALIPV